MGEIASPQEKRPGLAMTSQIENYWRKKEVMCMQDIVVLDTFGIHACVKSETYYKEEARR